MTYYYVAHMGALWRFNGEQYRKLQKDIKSGKEVDLVMYGGRLLTGRLVTLDNLILEVTS